MRWLLDEMLPSAATHQLAKRGHDAVAVEAVGLAGASDPEVFDFAVEEDRIVVTENFGDFSEILDQRLKRGADCVPVVFVHKTAGGGALPHHMARSLDAWASKNPDPYIGPHWL